MRYFRRCGSLVALIIWIWGSGAAVSQTLPDGLVLRDNRMIIPLTLALTDRSGRSLTRLLQSQVVCVSDRGFERFLNDRGIKTYLISAQTTRTALASGTCDMLIQGAAAKFVQAILTTPPQPDPTPNPDGDDVGNPTPVDREGPTIRPADKEFTSATRTATIRAVITDPSGVAGASTDGARMTPGNGGLYSAPVRVPNDYRQRIVTITATDRPGNSSTERVALRRVPACGPPDGISLAMARVIQTDLNVLGFGAGVVDGLIGPGSCAAIRKFLGRDTRSWPALIDALARARIGISARVNADPSAATQGVTVSLSDPRRSGAIARIRVTGTGQDRPDRPYEGRDLTYDFRLSPGETLSPRFLALDARSRVLAETGVSLRRLPDMTLRLSAAGLRAGQVESTSGTVRVTTTLDNPWPGAFVAWQDDAGDGERRSYPGTPITFDVPMPEPGETATAMFLALDRNGEARDRERLTLFRTPDMRLIVRAEGLEGREIRSASAEVTIFVDLLNAGAGAEVSVESGTDGSTTWTYTGGARPVDVRMPPPGRTSTVSFSARDRSGVVRDRGRITLRRADWMRLMLSAEGLEGGQLTTTSDSVTIRAEVGGVWPGAALSWLGGSERAGRQGIGDTPVDVQLPAPPPGESRRVVFELHDRAGERHAIREITLNRRPDMALALSADGLSGDRIETTTDEVVITADISDPWPGAQIRLSASDPVTLPYAGQPIPFTIAMPEPGESSEAHFAVLDGDSAPRVERTVTLVRSARMELALSGDGIAGGRLDSSEDQVTVTAEIRNLWPGASLEYRGPDGAGETRAYTGTAQGFELPMPAPGGEASIEFVALGPDQVTHDTETLVLSRAPVTLTVNPDPELQTDAEEGELTVLLEGAGSATRIEIRDESEALLVDASYTPGEDWIRAVPMPARGEARTVTVRAVGADAQVLASRAVRLVRPAPVLPDWLFPGAAGLVLGGVLWLIFRIFTTTEQPVEASRAPTPPPRIYAVPDPSPGTAAEPSKMPEIIFRIERGADAEITIETEEESDPKP